MRLAFTIALIVLTLAGCKAREKKDKDLDLTSVESNDVPLFEMERTPCFGFCAVFKLSVYEGGRAEYHGLKNVDRTGHFKGTLSKTQMEIVIAKAKAIGFYKLEAKYDGPVTDLPSTIITMHYNGKKTVTGRYGAPEVFKELAETIEKISEDISWEPDNSLEEK